MPEGMARLARRTGAALLATALVSLSIAGTAGAADSVYWVNSTGSTISHANLGGGGGADVPIVGAPVARPNGLAVDAAADKIYWGNIEDNTIRYANLDGSDGALFNTAGATEGSVTGLAIDPLGGRLYWVTTSANKISFANLDGSGGGDLATTGATVNQPAGLAIDPATGRIYWSNYSGNKISYANLDGSGGGGDLDTTGATVNGPEGVAIDPKTSRIYWTNYANDTIAYASLGGGGGGQLNTGAAPVEGPVGLAVDLAGTVFWANYSLDSIGYVSLNGSPSGVADTNGATIEDPAFPVLLERPHNAELPGVTGAHKPGSTIACSQGKWAADRVESFLSLAPRTISYQWFRNGQAIAGATGASTVASKVGAYSCTATAANFAGSESALSPIDFSVNATLRFKKVTFNRKKGTAVLRVAVTGAGRLDLFGKGVAKVRRKHATATAKLVVKTSGKARTKLRKAGKVRVKARISYTPEGGKAIKRFKTIMLKKKLRR